MTSFPCVLTQLSVRRFLPPQAVRRDEKISSRGQEWRGLQHTKMFISRLEQVLHRGQVTGTVTDRALAAEGCMAGGGPVLTGSSAFRVNPVGWQILKGSLVLLPKEHFILMSGFLRQWENWVSTMIKGVGLVLNASPYKPLLIWSIQLILMPSIPLPCTSDDQKDFSSCHQLLGGFIFYILAKTLFESIGYKVFFQSFVLIFSKVAVRRNSRSSPTLSDQGWPHHPTLPSNFMAATALLKGPQSL